MVDPRRINFNQCSHSVLAEESTLKKYLNPIYFMAKKTQDFLSFYFPLQLGYTLNGYWNTFMPY